VPAGLPPRARLGRAVHPEVDLPTLERWNADWRSDPDARGPVPTDPLEAWNARGRELFAAFVHTIA
jgi:hypothetical protein